MIVGLFNEARMHLKGLKRMVDLRGGIADDSVRKSIMLYTFLTYRDIVTIFSFLLFPSKGKRGWIPF
jgi:hypothetical protein